MLGRFVRLEGSRSRPGSGLGLSLAAAVARMHGGQGRARGQQAGLARARDPAGRASAVRIAGAGLGGRRMNRSLAERLVAAPRLSAPAAARRKLDTLAAAPEARDLAPLLGAGRTRDLLLGLAEHSPYLWTLATEDPARLARLLGHPPQSALEALAAAPLAPARRRRGRADARAAPRQARGRAARRARRHRRRLGRGRDDRGADPFRRRRASAPRSRSSCARTRSAVGSRSIRTRPTSRAPAGWSCWRSASTARGSSTIRATSTSSSCTTPRLPRFPQGAEPAPLFVRITKGLARLLQERTSDGYVLRVDLRLRPDPASTPVALSTISAYAYYETLGQNWERAALIKARPAAGDLDLGRQFLAELAPFIWRKYFDYAAIADIHAMKRQIHAVRGHEKVVVAGHDVKLGRGGIREVEFFVQTQQLIFGGRRPRMRGSRTLDMLKELHAEKWVTGEAVKDLTDAYCFLRTVEHRLQMVADEQTQRLPFERADLSRFARFCGYARLESFAARPDVSSDARSRRTTRGCSRTPRRSASPPAASSSPASPTIPRRSRRFAASASSIRRRRPRRSAAGTSAGRAGVRSARAREALTEVVPALLEAFAGSGDPDAALSAFDAAMAKDGRHGRAAVDPALERQGARAVRRRARLRAPARGGHRVPPARARRRDRPGPDDRFRGQLSARRRPACAPRRMSVRRATSRTRSTGRATSPPRRCS